MASSPPDLLKDALNLPAEARAALANSLLESLDSEVDDDAEEFWRIEIQHRLHEIDSGTVEMIPWTEARRTLRSRLDR
jgi:putative addiction module component (TIGR02574 family)